MAGRVNTKFVVILSATLVGIIIGLVGVWYLFVRTDPAEYIARADALAAQGQYVKAVEYYRRARSGRPGDVTLLLKHAEAMSQLQVSNSRGAQAMIARLLDVYKKVLDIEPQNPTAMHAIANIYMRLGRELGDLDAWDQLFKITNTTVLSDPTSKVAREYRGIAQVNRMFVLSVLLGDREMALEDLTEANEAFPDEPLIDHHLALWHVLEYQRLDKPSGNVKKLKAERNLALRWSRSLLEQYPDDVQIQVYHLRVLGQLGLNDEANKLANKLQRQLLAAPDSAQLVLEVARYLAWGGHRIQAAVPKNTPNLAKAQKLVQKAVAVHPHDIRLQVLNGQILTMMSQFDQAKKVFEQASNMKLKALPLVAYQFVQLRRAATVHHVDLVLREADLQTGGARETELNEVAELIEQMRSDVGDTAYVSMLLGKLELARQSWGAALAHLDRASAQFQDRKPDVLLLSASACVKLGELGAAVTRLESLLKIRSNYLPARFELAKLQLRLAQPAKAKVQIEMLLRADPTDAKAVQLQAVYFAQTNQPSKAIAIYNQLQPWKNQNIALRLARLYLSTDQKEAARALLDHHFQRSPSNLALLRELVQCVTSKRQRQAYFQQARQAGADPNALALLQNRESEGISAQAAIGAVTKIVDKIKDPFERAMGHYNLSRQLGQRQKMLKALAEAARLQPDSPQVAEALFVCALEDQDWDQAHKLIKQAKAKNTDLASGLLFGGRLEMAQGQMQSAVGLLIRGLKARPVYSEGWRWLALAQYRSGDLAAAETSYERAIKQRPNNLKAYQGLTATLTHGGRHHDALRVWRQAMTFASDDSVVREQYLLYEQRWGDLNRALKIRSQLAKTQPEDQVNRRGLAVLLAHMERFSEAQAVLDVLLTQSPDDRDNYGALATVLAVSHRVDEAKRVLKNYIASRGSKVTAKDWLMLGRFSLNVQDEATGFEAYRQAIKLDQSKRHIAMRELADAMFDRNKIKDAVLLYQSLWKSNRNDAKVGYRLVEAQLRNHQTQGALKTLDEMDKLSEGPSVTSFLLRSQVAKLAGKPQEALALLDEAIAQMPDKAMVYFQRATLLASDPLTEHRAIEDLRKVLELNPNLSAAHRLLAQIYLRRNSFEQAVRQLESLLRRQPHDVPTRLSLLTMYIDNQDMLAARTLLSASARRFPEEARWPLLQANLAIKRGKHRQAIKYLTKAFDLEPTAQTLATLSLQWIASSNPDRARKVIKAQAALLVGSPILQSILARAHYQQGHRTEAKRIFETALRACTHLDQMLGVTDQWIAAVGLVGATADLRAWSGQTSDSWIQMAIARGELSASKYDQAVNRLKRIEGRIKTEEKAQFRGLLALALHNSGDFKNAAEVYRQVLAEQPDNFAAMNNLAYLLAMNLGKPAEALALATKAAEQAANDPQVLDTLGWVQFLNGQSKPAQQTLRRSVRIKPFSANTYHLAEVLLKDGNSQYATELLDMARQFAEQTKDKHMLQKVNQRLKQVTQ